MTLTTNRPEAGFPDRGGLRARLVLEQPFVPEERRRANPHPGSILRADYLEPLGWTPYRLAKELRVLPTRVHQILTGKRSISADTALRLGRLLGTSAELWLNLQAAYDLEAAKYAPGTWDEIEQIRPLDLGPDPEEQPEAYEGASEA